MFLQILLCWLYWSLYVLEHWALLWSNFDFNWKNYATIKTQIILYFIKYIFRIHSDSLVYLIPLFLPVILGQLNCLHELQRKRFAENTRIISQPSSWSLTL